MGSAKSVKEAEAVVGFLVTKKGSIIHRVCLAIKQQKVGRGLYMPYGGKVEPGETYAQAMIRELPEESGVSTTAEDLEEVGMLFTHNYFKNVLVFRWRIMMYLIHHWDGTPVDTKEMKNARWFPRAKRMLPLSQMPGADRIFLPKILAGKYIKVFASYNLEDMTTMRENPANFLHKDIWIQQTTRFQRKR